MPHPLKIAITGPESTGKSMLAEQLAIHYGTLWVPEFARGYIDKLGRPYSQGDILEIAKGQIRLEQEIQSRSNTVLFCDTELIVTKIWSIVKYDNCNPWILRMIERNKYDLYLLCNIDLPWIDDPQREHPHLRRYLFELYMKELSDRGLNYSVVSGKGKHRLQNAVKIIEDRFPGLKNSQVNE